MLQETAERVIMPAKTGIQAVDGGSGSDLQQADQRFLKRL